MVIYLQAGKTFKVARKNFSNLSKPFSKGVKSACANLSQDIVTFRTKSAFNNSGELLEYTGFLTEEMAENFARKLGIKAEYSDFNIANLVSEALVDLKNAGLKLSGLRLKTENLDSEQISYSLNEGLLLINSKIDWVAECRLQNYRYINEETSSHHPLHEIYKGIIDGVIKKSISHEDIIKNKQLYSASHINEKELNGVNCNNFFGFLREVGAGIVGGQKYSKKVMDLYRKLGGIELKPVTNSRRPVSSYMDLVRTELENLVADFNIDRKPRLIKPNFRTPYKSLEYDGPYTIEQCVEIAGKLGINAEYSDVHIANFSTEAIINLAKSTDMDLSGIKVLCKPLEKGKYGTCLNNEITYNSHINWKNIEMQEMLSYSNRDYSTASPLHTFYHELIHALNLRNLGEKKKNEYLNLYKEETILHPIHSFIVSKYAVYLKRFTDLVAEVGAGLMCGKRYPKEILDVYRVFKGPELKIISSNADFSSKYQQYLNKKS